jgi:hypothetical protein
MTVGDLLLKLAGKQVPKAVGVNASGLLAAKMPGLYGIVAGGGGVVMFFPDSCEVAAFLVTAYDSTSDWKGGINGSVGAGAESASYLFDPTPGDANASSYSGAFFTVAGGPLGPLSGSLFAGVPDPVTGGQWFGAGVSFGPGGGAAYVVWDYKLLLSIPVAPQCLCYALVFSEP